MTNMRPSRAAVAVLCVLMSAMAFAEERQAWTTSSIHGSPDPPSPFLTEIAFPNLKFDEPVCLTHVPGSNRLVVVERFGKIYTFENSSDTKADSLLLFLDVAKALDVERVETFGIAFHPDFEQNGQFFVHHHRGDQKLPTRVSSFIARKEPHWQADPDSETLIISWPAGHNGGSIKFGPDGYLYVTNGDQGGFHDPDEVGQGISDLQASILRIDVDTTDGQPYSIPPDNPFIDIPEARQEVWAYGLRNPWRISFDRKSGELWTADVGEDLWESVHIVKRGGNYGWSVEEGGRPFRPSRKRGPTPIQKPIVAHDHSEARSITGGYVYRGRRLPSLIGQYIYGDYDTGILWGLAYDGKQITKHHQLCDTNLRLVAFGEDRNAELILVDHVGGYLHRLIPNETADTSAEFPRLLSQTGLFKSTKDLEPEDGLIAYDVVAPQWCDHATKQRYMALPNKTQIEFEAVRFPFRGGRDGWKFPDGTVLVETVYLEMSMGDPASKRRMETRILHHERLRGPEDVGDQLWRAYTYVWNDEQTDAELLEEPRGRDQQFTIQDEAWPNGRRTQTWHFPGRTECSACHNMAAKYALGCQTLQANHQGEFGGRKQNQLEYFQQLNIFSEPLPKPAAELPGLVNYHDSEQSLEDRARSYLHANCSHCHRNGGGGNSEFFALGSFKLDDLKIVDSDPSHGAFHIPGARIINPGRPFKSVLYYRMSSLGGGRMPRLGSRMVDSAGLDLMHHWISSIDSDAGPLAEPAWNDIKNSTVAALRTARALGVGELPEELRDSILRNAAESEPHIRDLFERFLPEEQRVKRIGNSIDAASILSLKGSAARGKRVFLEQAGVQCKSCHKIGDNGEAIGPPLDQIGKKLSSTQILTSILQPSQNIAPEYLLYQCITTDGKTYSGLVVEKADEFVVLRDANGKSAKISTDDIDLLAAQATSIMPELLVRDLTAQQVADLVAYLASLQGSDDGG